MKKRFSCKIIFVAKFLNRNKYLRLVLNNIHPLSVLWWNYDVICYTPDTTVQLVPPSILLSRNVSKFTGHRSRNATVSCKLATCRLRNRTKSRTRALNSMSVLVSHFSYYAKLKKLSGLNNSQLRPCPTVPKACEHWNNLQSPPNHSDIMRILSQRNGKLSQILQNQARLALRNSQRLCLAF